ncbi:MAG: NADH-quinone oxidoreductase subunit NuoH [Candidatus Hydrothermarchaeota archaeon]|nr:NADH-quinone oxidoreductase subunit NuoH [Candidatus Hydrothermarchaeota archaeon]
MPEISALLSYLSNPWIRGIVGALGLASIIAGSIILLLWVERKFIGRLQHRYGPNRVGKYGILQLVVDGIKLFTKEDIIPSAADRLVFTLAPIIGFAVALLPFLAIPFSENIIVSDLNIGILYILAVSSLAVVPTIMAGWSPNNKYNLLGGMRAAATMISYEVPMGLAIIGVVMLTGSLSMIEIVKAQDRIWFVFPQIIGFTVFLVAAFMEAARLPFDLPEAESEIVQGWTTEYSGIKFAMLLFAEYIHSILASLLVVVLFLGGWHGPILPAPIWLLIKTLLVMLVLMWMRATVPRVRIDQLLNVGWKVLIPLALFNIGFTGFLRVIMG